MNRNKVFTVLRVVLAVAVWLGITKLYGYYIDPHLDGVLPPLVRMIIASMVVPYTVALGAFCLVVIGIPRVKLEGTVDKFGALDILQFFMIQTGLSFPCLIIVNIICKIFGRDIGGITADDLFGNLPFYIVLLLIFNPVFEELLFRKFVLERLSCLGVRGAVICSAVIFALPHVVSQGVAQMFYTLALGLVWAYVTVRTRKLWPAIVLHSLSNLYCAFIPMIAAEIHPLVSVAYTMGTLVVMVPATVVLLSTKGRGMLQ